MTTTNTIDIAAVPAIGHREAMDLQAEELDRSIALLKTLQTNDWEVQTECPDWDVRAMWLHVLGACESGASMREGVHQMRAARRLQKHSGTTLEAGLSSTQVAEREHLSPSELVDRLAAVAPRTIKARTRIPRLVRSVKMSVDAPVVEKWSVGYLTDIIYLRDTWMHRVDTAYVLGRELELTGNHDGRLVADVVAEWARRHGRPFSLELTGPAGGLFEAEGGAEALQMSAVDFCRVLAGRGEPTGLLATIVPF